MCLRKGFQRAFRRRGILKILLKDYPLDRHALRCKEILTKNGEVGGQMLFNSRHFSLCATSAG